MAKRSVLNKLVLNSTRELIRVNITIETDEDDLIGGFRLVNGETVWHNGPVIEALDSVVLFCSLMRLTLPQTKSFVSNPFLKEKELFLKKTGQVYQSC